MDSKLSSPTAAEFEARAAAGEKPVLEWWTIQAARHHPVSVPMFQTGDSIRIYLDNEGLQGKYHMCFGVKNDPENNPHFRSMFTDSIEAAQLAAEHFLREAARPLFAKELAHVADLKDQFARLQTQFFSLTKGHNQSMEYWEGRVVRYMKELSNLNKAHVRLKRTVRGLRQGRKSPVTIPVPDPLLVNQKSFAFEVPIPSPSPEEPKQ